MATLTFICNRKGRFRVILIILKAHKQREKSFCYRSVKITEDHGPRHSLKKATPKAAPSRRKRKITKIRPDVFEGQNLTAVEAFNFFFCCQMPAEAAIAINLFASCTVALHIIRGEWQLRSLFSPRILQWEYRLP